MIPGLVAKELEKMEHEEAQAEYDAFIASLRARALRDAEAVWEENTTPLYRIIKIEWDSKNPGFQIQKLEMKQEGYGQYEHYAFPVYHRNTKSYRERIKTLSDPDLHKTFVEYRPYGKRHSTLEAAERWLRKFVDAPKEVLFRVEATA